MWEQSLSTSADKSIWSTSINFFPFFFSIPEWTKTVFTTSDTSCLITALDLVSLFYLDYYEWMRKQEEKEEGEKTEKLLLPVTANDLTLTSRVEHDYLFKLVLYIHELDVWTWIKQLRGIFMRTCFSSPSCSCLLLPHASTWGESLATFCCACVAITLTSCTWFWCFVSEGVIHNMVSQLNYRKWLSY